MLPLVSHVEYASRSRALLRLEKNDGTNGQTDGRQTVTLRLPLDAASVVKRVTVKILTTRYCSGA